MFGTAEDLSKRFNFEKNGWNWIKVKFKVR